MASNKVFEEAEYRDKKGGKSFHRGSCSHVRACVPHHHGDYKWRGAIHLLTKVWSISGSQSAAQPHKVPETLFALFTVCGTRESWCYCYLAPALSMLPKSLCQKRKVIWTSVSDKKSSNCLLWEHVFFLSWSHSAARMGDGKLFLSCCAWRWVLKSQWIILFVLWMPFIF